MMFYELLLPAVTLLLIVTPGILVLVGVGILFSLASPPWARGRQTWLSSLVFLGAVMAISIAFFALYMYWAIDTSALGHILGATAASPVT